MIEVNGVCLSFSGRTILSGFDCRFGIGLNLLSGPSGCGKSSLISMILGQLSPDEGEIKLPRGCVVSYCGNRKSMFYEHSLRWNLRRFLRLESLPDELLALADEMSAGDLLDRPAGGVSGGQRRKIEVLFCLAKRADVYVMDEPFSGLDKASKEALSEYLESIRERACFIIVNHDPTIDLAPDCSVTIADGKAICRGEPRPFVVSSGMKRANPKISPFSCLRHYFESHRGFFVSEILLAFACLLACFACLAVNPPSSSEAIRASIAADPDAGMLFGGEVKTVDYDSFASLVGESAAVVLPFAAYDESDYSYGETGGYVIPYDGTAFLLAQGSDGGAGFSLSKDFSYVDGGFVVHGSFDFVDAFDQRLSFLMDYSLFDKAVDSGRYAFFLCPKEEFESVVCSLVNGDFSSTNTVEIGDGEFALLPPIGLAQVGFNEWTGRVGFSLTGSKRIEVVPGDEYRLSLDWPANRVGLITSEETVPCEMGDYSMSFSTYLYLAFCASSLRYYGNPLAYLGFAKDSIPEFASSLTPLFGIEYHEQTLSQVRYWLLGCSIGLSLIYLVVFISSSPLYRRPSEDINEVLSMNGVVEARRKALIVFSECFWPIIGLAISAVAYLAGMIPLFNFLQFDIDYGLSYASLGSAFAGVGMVSFYSPSALAVIMCALPILSLSRALLVLLKPMARRRRR